MQLPTEYKWLEQLSEPPKMLVEMLKLYGTLESPGERDNIEILSWAREVGCREYIHDSIAWCGLTMALVAKRASKSIPNTPLWALSWIDFGKEAATPMLGDVLVFKRKGGGHVTMYIGEDELCYHCLGGNQGDKVGITRILKMRLFEARRPVYVKQPASVQKYILSAQGVISSNEA